VLDSAVIILSLSPKQSRFADSFENNGLASRLWERGKDEQAGCASQCFDAGVWMREPSSIWEPRWIRRSDRLAPMQTPTPYSAEDTYLRAEAKLGQRTIAPPYPWRTGSDQTGNGSTSPATWGIPDQAHLTKHTCWNCNPANRTRGTRTTSVETQNCATSRRSPSIPLLRRHHYSHRKLVRHRFLSRTDPNRF
jgi:hypothetical protein